MAFGYGQLIAPQPDAFAVTPSDVTTQPANALYVGTTGNVAVVTEAGTTVTFSNVPVGILPIRVIQVLSTGTTASNIVGLKSS